MVFIVLLAWAGLPAILVWLLNWRRAHWSSRKIIIVAAAPVPLIVAIVCLMLIALLLTTPAAQCAIDDCAADIDTAFRVIVLAGGEFFAGLLTAFASTRLARRGRQTVSEADVFQ